MLKTFIIGLIMGSLMTAIGAAVVLDKEIKKDSLIQALKIERDFYKNTYEKYWED